MATVQFKSGFTTDPETGCVRGYNDYEQCRTNFFLKQQNQILKNQQSSSNNGDAKVMGTTTEAQIETQANNNLAAVEAAMGGFSFPLTYVLIIIATMVITAVVTRYLTKPKKINL